MQTKKCNTCKKELPFSEFHINKTTRDGYSNKCKKCTLAYSKRRYWENPDKFRKRLLERQRARRKTGYCTSCGNLAVKGKSLCKECSDRKIVKFKKRYAAYKELVFSHYGGACACCGETIPEFLTIDHINNNGSAHRKEIKGVHLYQWIVDHNYPDDLQVLCWNCNMGKYHNNGVCPHVTRKEKI